MLVSSVGYSVRLLSILALAVMGWLGVPLASAPGWIITSDTIPAGDVIDNDVIITGTNVVIDGTVNGDVVAFGSSVTLNGTVHGSLVSVADEVASTGT